MARIFDGATRIAAWPPDARGIAYGDGVFETMRVHRGVVPWWDAHWQRLTRGAQRLRMALPAEGTVRDELTGMFDDGGDGVTRLLVSRGGGGRGYAPAADARPLWMLSRFPLPAPASSTGLQLHRCATVLALQPALAGIKHCNRLEQVLARAECVDAGADEGLMLDIEGHVVGGTSANLFMLRDDGWLTPSVARCGIAGVCRSHLLSLLRAREAQIPLTDLENADAVFLCNAVRGILPVARIGSHAWPSHPAIAQAREALASIHPGFVVDTTP